MPSKSFFVPLGLASHLYSFRSSQLCTFRSSSFVPLGLASLFRSNFESKLVWVAAARKAVL